MSDTLGSFTMYFEAKLSVPLKIISAVITAFLIFTIVHQIYLGWRDGGGFLVAGVFVAIFIAAILFIILLGRPTGYKLEDGRLEIVRWKKKSVIIPLSEIEAAELSTIAFRKCIRLFGNGGFFGMYGTFKEIGGPKFKAWITDTKNAVTLKTKTGLVVISPHNRDLFLERMSECLTNHHSHG